MQTNYFLLPIALLATISLKAQTLYSERFNTLSLTTGTNITTNANFGYNSLPNGMLSINNGNLKADTLSANYPFKAAMQSQQGWLSYKPTPNTNTNDTFAVSTSWLLPVGTANSWMITPLITNIASNSVLSWEAMAPDASNADGYEVYISTNTNTLVSVNDFSNKLLTVAAENKTWTKRGLSLAAFAGQSIRIAFKNNSTDKYQLWVDDIVVENVSNQYDVAGLSNNTYKYGLTNINQPISATFQNKGYAPITSLLLNYKMGNNPTVFENFNFSTPINFSDTKLLTASNPFISSLVAYNDLKIWVGNINGQADQVPANDTVIGFITTQASTPSKKIFVEEITDTKCGWCPDGQEALKTIATNTNVVVASFHGIGTYYNGLVSTAIINPFIDDSNFPVAIFDRNFFSDYGGFAINQINWNNHLSQRQSLIVPATVSITNVSYNSSTRVINAIVSSNFVGNIKGDYRLHLYIKENNVHGPAGNSAWHQLSYFYNVPSSPYYQIGTVVPSTTNNPIGYTLNENEYRQQFVINDVSGEFGTIPSNSTTAGQTYTTAFTYTLPVASGGEFRWNDFNTYLIATVSENGTDIKQRTILNVTETKLTTDPESVVSINEQSKTDLHINLYPNPATDAVMLSYQLKEKQSVIISVYNTLGELQLQENTKANVGETNQVMSVSKLASGNYSVVLRFKNEVITQKLTIIK